MLKSRKQYSLQRGSSVIELPVIILVMVVLVLFIININQGINQKNKLNSLAYSLASIVACAECDNTMLPLDSASGSSMPTVKLISTDVADQLLLVAQGSLNALMRGSSATVGLHLEQVIFESATQKPQLLDVNSGAECVSVKPLITLTDLSPFGTTQGVNAGKHAGLFQVTICIKGLGYMTGDIAPLLLRDFNDSYYQSSALLIGRAL